MRIETESGLVFDEADPRCFCDINILQRSDLIGFVQCLDNTNNTRRYMGHYRHDNRAGSIKQIMDLGGKWPRLRPED